MQLAGVGAIAGLTYAIVRHHKEMVVVGGALTAQGDPRARPVATSAAMRAWELRHIRLLTVEQLLALRSVTVPLNETAAKVYRIASMEAHGATGGGPPYERVVLHTDTGETLHVTAMRRTRNATGAAHRHAFELPPLPWDDSPLAPALAGGAGGLRSLRRRILGDGADDTLMLHLFGGAHPGPRGARAEPSGAIRSARSAGVTRARRTTSTRILSRAP